MANQHLDPQHILREFREWSLEEQLALVRSLIEAMQQHNRSMKNRPSVYDLAGIARTGDEVPSDEQIEAWRDERRERN